MSWLFSQALAEEYSAGTCLDGQQFAQLSVMPTQHKFWRYDKTIDASGHSLFGLTSQVLTDDHGAELLMSYLAASRARTSARPAKELELMGNEADCGSKCGASYAKYDPDMSMWKTVQYSLLGDSEEFLETWPRWGSMRNGVSYLRQIPVLYTCESESGLWQTPIVDDAINRKQGKWNSRGEPKLSAEVTLFPTPTVCGNYNRKGASATSGDGLATVVRRFPTPNASDATKWSNQSLEERKAKGQQVRLNTAVSPEGGAGGLLNPNWVEWLMGWPIGWTELKPLAMDKFREWQQQHGQF